VSNEQQSLVGTHSPDWASLSTPEETEATGPEASENGDQPPGGPWHSKPNRTDPQNGGEKVCTPEIDEEREETYRELAKEFVKNAEGDLEGRIFRALSVSGDTRLRREAVRERRGQGRGYRAKTVAGVMQEFLTWFLEQEDLVIRFDSFDMEAGSSFDKDAALERYGGLCDLERGALEACRQSGDDLYTALLGITASHLNANGEYRCVADHWREMKYSWSNHTRQEQQRVFDELGAERYDPDVDYELRSAIGYVLDDDSTAGRWWEYVRIAEPHKSGFAHHHIAVLTNFEISVETFEPVIARHVKETPSANWSAHEMYADDPDDRCVSVNQIDPESEEGEEAVGSLASYLSGYLSEFDENDEYVEMLGKPASEVMFAATAWATGSRKIDYSNGGHKLKALGYEQRPEKYKKREPDGEVPPPISVKNTKTGDEHDILEPGSVEMVSVEDQQHLDPEKQFPGGVPLEADTG